MYGFMDKEWLDDDSINETTLSDWIKEKFSDSEAVCDFVGKWFVRRGYKLDESLDNVPESILQMVEDDARDILNPHEATELQKSLETDSPFDRHMESVASKFDKCMSKIWECMSTDMMGNSQPTAGVFSGDNFAAGDLRQPVVIGGYSSFGKIGKPKRKKKSPVKEAVDDMGAFSAEDLFEYIQNYAFNRPSTDRDGFANPVKVMKGFVFHYPSLADAAMDAWRKDRQHVLGLIKKGIEDRLDSGCHGRSSHDDFDCDGNEDYWKIEDDPRYKSDRGWSEI